MTARTRRYPAILTITVALACAGAEAPRTSDATGAHAPESSASATDTTVMASSNIRADTVWYHRVRLLDVTGDGRVDSLDLQARGPSADSSILTFRVLVDGEVAFTDSWSSDYEFIDPPPQAATAAGRDSLLRAYLDTTLSQIRVMPIDPAQWSGPWTGESDDCMDEPRDCLAQQFRDRATNLDWSRIPPDSVAAVYQRVRRAAFDTAAVLRIANDMRRPGAVQFMLSYGYETTMHLAWSPTEKEVFVIFECC
jgi:hypothetical protein